jgi:hypothetical protein
METLTGGEKGPAVAFRFFGFKTHDPQALGRLLSIFLRDLVGALVVVAVLGAVVVTGMWCFSTLGRVRNGLARGKRARRS